MSNDSNNEYIPLDSNDDFFLFNSSEISDWSDPYVTVKIPLDNIYTTSNNDWFQIVIIVFRSISNILPKKIKPVTRWENRIRNIVFAFVNVNEVIIVRQ